MKKTVLTSFTILCLLSTVFLVGLFLNVHPVKADWTWTETIYIKADGSIEPDTAPISTVDNITYTLTDNIIGDVPSESTAIAIERDNIVFDGAGYIVQGTGAYKSKGISLSGRSNVTIKHVKIIGFDECISLYVSYDNKIFGNKIINDDYGIFLNYSTHNHICGNTIMHACRKKGSLTALSGRSNSRVHAH